MRHEKKKLPKFRSILELLMVILNHFSTRLLVLLSLFEGYDIYSLVALMDNPLFVFKDTDSDIIF